MMIRTTRFGEIEVARESILSMPEGMLGFESQKRFVLLADKSPFKWLQAVDDPGLAFVVVDPMDFFADYDFEMADSQAESLCLECADDAIVVTTVTADGKEDLLTTNLLGPVVINHRNRLAKQVVIQNDRYGTKHVIGVRAQADATPEAAKAA